MKLTKSVLMRLIKEEISRMQEGYYDYSDNRKSDQEIFNSITGNPDKDSYIQMERSLAQINDMELSAKARRPLDKLKRAILFLHTGTDDRGRQLSDEQLSKYENEKKQAYNELEGMNLLDKVGIDRMNGPFVGESRRRRRVLPRRK